MKKYYKCLRTEKLQFPCYDKNVIYPEDYKAEDRYCFVKDDVSYDHNGTDFQEVPEIEYMLQEAVKAYPIGTKVYSWDTNEEDRGYIIKIISLPYKSVDRIFVDFQIIKTFDSYYVKRKNVPQKEFVVCRKTNIDTIEWAKIVKEEKFILPEKWCIRQNEVLINDWANKNKQTDINYYSLNGQFLFHYPKINKNHLDTVVKEGYTEISFEEFKKYVLKREEKMETKKIISYKLIKPEYKEACDKIIGACDEIGVNSLAADKFKKAGVLDLWFEPVYEPEFKVGDWVTRIVDRGGPHKKGICFEIKMLNDNDQVIDQNKVSHTITSIRLATPEEIEEAQTPNIAVNGYKAEFFSTYVKFGCVEISKEVFIDLATAKDYKHTNREVESVTIGKGEFTKDQIKEIVNYYKYKYGK